MPLFRSAWGHPGRLRLRPPPSLPRRLRMLSPPCQRQDQEQQTPRQQGKPPLRKALNQRQNGQQQRQSILSPFREGILQDAQGGRRHEKRNRVNGINIDHRYQAFLLPSLRFVPFPFSLPLLFPKINLKSCPSPGTPLPAPGPRQKWGGSKRRSPFVREVPRSGAAFRRSRDPQGSWPPARARQRNGNGRTCGRSGNRSVPRPAPWICPAFQPVPPKAVRTSTFSAPGGGGVLTVQRTSPGSFPQSAAPCGKSPRKTRKKTGFTA